MLEKRSHLLSFQALLLIVIHDQSAVERMPNKAGYLLTTGNYNVPVCSEKFYTSNRTVEEERYRYIASTENLNIIF